MFWKILALALLATVVVAQEYKVTDEQREQLKGLLTAQCKKAGAEDKTTDVENAGKNFVNCIKDLVNIDVLKNEIEEAKPNGALDEVFKKYCAKSPQLKTCINTLVDGVVPCIEEDSRGYINFVRNGTDQLIDFVCYKDGDRIAMFIAEQGPECFQQKASEIRECATKARESVTSIDGVKSMTLEERCAKFDQLSTCVVTALEKCDTTTPSNMVESLFKYVRKSSPCNK